MIKAFITAFCLGCIVIGALYIMIPERKMSKPVSYAFSLAFLCLVLSAAGRINNISVPKISESADELNNERLSAAAAQMVFAEALSREGIKFSKITVFTDKSESGSISITKVCVFTAAGYEKVRSVIGSDSYEVVVVNE